MEDKKVYTMDDLNPGMWILGMYNPYKIVSITYDLKHQRYFAKVYIGREEVYPWFIGSILHDLNNRTDVIAPYGQTKLGDYLLSL